MNFSLTEEQYEALIALARRGATTAAQTRSLESFLGLIESQNGIVRHKLWIQWQEADSELPASAKFPEKWPPELRHYVELISRPITKDDVAEVLRLYARKPVTVLVSPDPAALVGWTTVESFFPQ